MTETKPSEDHHVCPFWVGYLLASPLRKLLQNPGKILAPYVKPGMRVLDIGCAMGFFSLPMARLVGPNGRVICVDLQQKMLDALLRRARRGGLDARIEARLCGSDSVGITNLAGQIDFALAFAVVHEIPDTSRLFADLHAALKPGGTVLVAEPRGRVRPPAFEESVATAAACGFERMESPKIGRSHAAVLQKGGK
jgi:2-polyprenyl-3-methyl-5-hydroxy-6-metoxy-1,4-benzoquinol methylase